MVVSSLRYARGVPSSLVSVFNHWGSNPSAKRTMMELTRGVGVVTEEGVVKQILERGDDGWVICDGDGFQKKIKVVWTA